MTFLKAGALATAVMLSGSSVMLNGQSPSVSVSVFGETKEGETVERYTLTNENGLSAEIMTWGATLIAVNTPDRDGRMDNVTLHLGTFAEYEKGHPLFGSVVGRFANRIDGGGFEIDGVRHDLATVNEKTGVHIHGGKEGLASRLWRGQAIEGEGFSGVELTHASPDGHEGYPGTVQLTVIYRLTNDNALEIEYRGTTDKPTHLNLTNHAYFNLGGAGSGDVLDQVLMLKADKILAIDERKIPTGAFLSVDQTPFDFRTPRAIGERINEVEGGGYDHCYVLNESISSPEPVWFARLYDPDSGRVMDVLTTSPGVQLYTANYLKPGLATPDGRAYGPHHGVCLETQYFPNTPNRPAFPSSLVRPGEEFHQKTVFRFTVAND